MTRAPDRTRGIDPQEIRSAGDQHTPGLLKRGVELANGSLEVGAVGGIEIAIGADVDPVRRGAGTKERADLGQPFAARGEDLNRVRADLISYEVEIAVVWARRIVDRQLEDRCANLATGRSRRVFDAIAVQVGLAGAEVDGIPIEIEPFDVSVGFGSIEVLAADVEQPIGVVHREIFDLGAIRASRELKCDWVSESRRRGAGEQQQYYAHKQWQNNGRAEASNDSGAGVASLPKRPFSCVLSDLSQFLPCCLTQAAAWRDGSGRGQILARIRTDTYWAVTAQEPVMRPLDSEVG